MKKALKQPRLKEAAPLTPADFLSSGALLLNLACSGRPYGAYAKGLYYFLVGDSAAGKTWLLFTAMAEACANPAFDGYRLIYDPTTEDGAQFDVPRFFGSKLAKRLEVQRSETLEEWYYNLDDALKGDPFIYATDSENGLRSKAGDEKFEELKEAFRKGKVAPGSYGMDKAKLHSQNMPRVCGGLRDTRSILFVAGQTRDNIDPLSPERRTRSGGRSLRFYATVEMWLSIRQHLTRTVLGKPRKIGIVSQIDVKKNRFVGANRSVQLPIFNSFGLDDVGACVDFLVAEGAWSKPKGQSEITAPELDIRGSREALVEQIEAEKMEKDLRSEVVDLWREIEAKCAIRRNQRYQ